MRNGLRMLTAATTAALLMAAPAAAKPFAEATRIIPLEGNMPNRSASISGDGFASLYVNPDEDIVLRRDDAGRWREHFKLDDGTGYARLAALEDGGGLAAWDAVGALPRKRPRLYLNAASTYRGRMNLVVYCSAACRIGGTVDGRAIVPYRKRALFGYELSSVSVRLPPGTKRVRMRLTATDARGRTTRLARTLTEIEEEAVWDVRP